MSFRNTVCPQCGYEFKGNICPLCSGEWETWELQFAAIALPRIREQIGAWLAQVPQPLAVEIAASTGGVKVRLYAPPGVAQGIVKAWAAMIHQQTRWKRTGERLSTSQPFYALRTNQRIPNLVTREGDPFLALSGLLLGQAQPGQETSLRIWVLGVEKQLQERARALAAYSYGSGHGVEGDAPNPWVLRLALWRFVSILGAGIAALSGGSLAAGWLSAIVGFLGLISGGILFLVGALGMQAWMEWRSIPQEVLERRAKDTLLKVCFSLDAPQPQSVTFLSGRSYWGAVDKPEWPGVRAYTIPLPAGEIAALITPPQAGEGSGVIDRQVQQDVPAPPPSPALVSAPFVIGESVATGESIGVDPDGHGVIAGGSRTGKSSLVYVLLKQLIERGQDAPGIFLVDPHLGLADAFLQAVDDLPPDLRGEGIRRLRVITPDQSEVVPLNLLAVPEYEWAGNAIIDVGQRIWDDYWGPRMQAALQGLFRLAHAWNMHNPDDRLGLLHIVFLAFNTDWRHDAMAYLSPVERMGALALDALLGQLAGKYGNWSQGWVTEVVSPIMSKAMALELSPWLFAAMHQNHFVDLEGWIKERAWIVMRLPSGKMGREGARLTAGVVYNVFDAVFRKVTLYNPQPFYFVIDETQEIGAGMRLENMLSEGAKFGARVFALAQSLSMLRRIEGFEAVVQSLLANTSTQAFFSPDPEDADLIRATLNMSMRYGDTTLDLPSLQAWLRARVGGRWQPPTLLKVDHIPPTDPKRVQGIIREVISAHPGDYASPDDWQAQAVEAMKALVPYSFQGLLSEMLTPEGKMVSRVQGGENEKKGKEENSDHRRLGF